MPELNFLSLLIWKIYDLTKSCGFEGVPGFTVKLLLLKKCTLGLLTIGELCGIYILGCTDLGSIALRKLLFMSGYTLKFCAVLLILIKCCRLASFSYSSYIF